MPAIHSVLIVEDNLIVAMVIEDDLRDAGYEVLGPTMRSAPSLDIARSSTISLALVDIDLDGGDDGVDLARRLRDEHQVPSLYITGQAAVARAGKDAALGLLPKPFTPEQLLEAVAEALKYAATGKVPQTPKAAVWF